MHFKEGVKLLVFANDVNFYVDFKEFVSLLEVMKTG